MGDEFAAIRASVARYYTGRIKSYGNTARGVDWNSVESQVLRFDQLLKVLDDHGPLSINDYGCGYGALVEHLTARGDSFAYHGFDISGEMISRARELHRGVSHCEFTIDPSRLPVADYTVASGIFNVKQTVADTLWTRYVVETIRQIAARSRRGFAFNCLTKYSDPDRMRSDLYYADPCWLFDHCKCTYSRFVALLHDYPLYEFTLLVRKPETR